jgi:hypothetical protein
MSYEDDLKEINFKYDMTEMATLPGITKQDREVIHYGGTDFYTNEKLRQKFILTLLKNTPSKSHKKIIELVNKKIIIPAFLTKSTLSYYLKNIFGRTRADDKFSGVYGFYAIKDKKIFVLIDTGYKILTWVPDRHLAAVTLHECMHMAEKKDPVKFMKVNAVPLYKYYSTFLDTIFDMKNNNKTSVLDWILYIRGFENKQHSLEVNEYANKILKAVKPYSKLPNGKIDIQIDNIITYAFKSYDANSSMLTRLIREYSHIYLALMNAYEKVFKFRAITTAYQELFTISEVICMLATMELGKNKYVSDTLDILL